MRLVLVSAALVIVGAVAAVADVMRQNECGDGMSSLGIAGWTLIAAGAVGTFTGVRRQLSAQRWLALAPAAIALVALLAAMGAAVIAHSLESICGIHFGV